MTHRPINHIQAGAVHLLKDAYNVALSFRNHVILKYRRQRLKVQQERLAFEQLLMNITKASPYKFTGRILIDAAFDNPNFWYRLTLLRAALGLAHADEVAFTGLHNARQCRKTLNNLGIYKIIKFKNYYPTRAMAKRQARDLLENTHTSSDILNWKLPYDFPTGQAYDSLLKWQRSAEVNLSDPLLKQFLTTCLQQLHAAYKIINEGNYDLIMISQLGNFDEAGLAWIAAQRGIPTLIVTGHGGLARYRKGFTTDRIFAGGDRATKADIESLTPDQKEKLKAIGDTYLSYRKDGRTNELGAIFAYKNRSERTDRERLIKMFGWDETRPIVVVYAANWFDFPHAFGMSNFRDFLDWTQCTLEAAIQNTSVNWLFKGHPVDHWYGGTTLHDILPKKLPAHIAIVPDTFNSKDIIHSVDAMVTVHGTAGLEFTHSNRPVLVADKGWYHDAGFTKLAHTREEYVQLLSKQWWKDLDMKEAMDRCNIFAGILYCCPDWQANLINGDDSAQSKLFSKFHDLVHNNQGAFNKELDLIHDWYESDTEGFHTFKMMQAKDYSLSNLWGK